MSIDYETLKKITENKYHKLKDGIYDGCLFKITYDEFGQHNIPKVNFHFKINNKKTSKSIFLTNKQGKINTINKQILDGYLKIITNEYPEYSNRKELERIIININIGEIPITLTLMTPIGTTYQNFKIEFEN